MKILSEASCDKIKHNVFLSQINGAFNYFGREFSTR